MDTCFCDGLVCDEKILQTDKVSVELLDPLFLYAFLGVIIGARLGELFYNFDIYQGMPLGQVLIEVFYQFKEIQMNPCFWFVERI